MTDATRELRLVVTTHDLDAAVSFYRDHLGLRQEATLTDDNGGRAVVLRAGRATLELADMAHTEAVDARDVGHRVAGELRVAFEVADAAGTAARLVAAGAIQVAPVVRTPGGSTNARLVDPGGQQISVWSTNIYIVDRPRLDGPVVLAEPDPGWGPAAASLLGQIKAALGAGLVVAAHVGSTSVPGLAAKPVLDLVLGVLDPSDEDAYVPALEPLGFALALREPQWHQHRLLRRSDPAVNLHVFAAGEEEIDRMVAFRDHLRCDSADRALYGRTKRDLAQRTWAFIQDYADAKSDVVAEIMARAQSAPIPPLRGCFVVVWGPDQLPPGGAAAMTPEAAPDPAPDPARNPAPNLAPHLARDLAARLEIPLLSHVAAMQALNPRAADPVGEGGGVADLAADLAADLVADRVRLPAADLVRLLVAIAADCGGAVLQLPASQRRAIDLSVLPGQVVAIDSDTDGVIDSGIRLGTGLGTGLGTDTVDELAVERAVRWVRQVTSEAADGSGQ